MFPIYWGPNMFGEPIAGAAAFGLIARGGYLGDDLPEEVREAIENRKDQIHSEEDIEDIAEESKLRR